MTQVAQYFQSQIVSVFKYENKNLEYRLFRRFLKPGFLLRYCYGVTHLKAKLTKCAHQNITRVCSSKDIFGASKKYVCR